MMACFCQNRWTAIMANLLKSCRRSLEALTSVRKFCLGIQIFMLPLPHTHTFRTLSTCTPYDSSASNRYSHWRWWWEYSPCKRGSRWSGRLLCLFSSDLNVSESKISYRWCIMYPEKFQSTPRNTDPILQHNRDSMSLATNVLRMCGAESTLKAKHQWRHYHLSIARSGSKRHR